MKSNKSSIPEGDSDLVAQTLAAFVKAVGALIEGKFIDSFHIDFEIEGQQYELLLKGKHEIKSEVSNV